MTTEPWDLTKTYDVGDTALVKGVECVTKDIQDIESLLAAFQSACTFCPMYVSAVCDVRSGLCSGSIGEDNHWVAVDKYMMAKLRGKA